MKKENQLCLNGVDGKTYAGHFEIVLGEKLEPDNLITAPGNTPTQRC